MTTKNMVPVYYYRHKFTGEPFKYHQPLTEAEMIFLDLVWGWKEHEQELTIGSALKVLESKGYVLKRIDDDIFHSNLGDTLHSFRIKGNKLQKYNYFVGEWEVVG